MRASFLISIAFLLSVAPAATAQTPAPKTFDIYVVDVEGGDSVLFVSPSGESLLMDMAGGGTTTRDVDRVMDGDIDPFIRSYLMAKKTRGKLEVHLDDDEDAS